MIIESTHKVLYVPVLFLVTFLFHTASVSAVSASPPHRTGEVAVYASPSELAGSNVVRYFEHAGISIVSVAPGRELAEVARHKHNGRRAGLNLIANKSASSNDPYIAYQWHFDSVQADQAWAITSGAGVTVAVLDTGFRQAAPDGVDCVVAGYDFINNDYNPSDDEGHGTHVIGTIAQSTNNAVGVAGLANDSCIMPVKVLDENGSGSFSTIADGIFYAVDNGAQVINMSLGVNARYGIESDPVMDPALDYAYANGVTVVAAAGNDGHRKNISYPAIYPSAIGVGATGVNNSVPRYSNRGKGLDVVAPGGDTSKDLNGDGYVDGVLQETFGSDGSWGYYFYQGTSMAAPHVSAIAAMLIASGAATTPDDVKTVLEASALDLAEPGYDNTTGHGLVQAFDALNWSAGGSGPTNELPASGFTHSCSDLTCNFTDTSSDIDGTIVSWLWDFGDGATSTSQNPNHSYGAYGDYIVTLVVTDNENGTDSSNQTVTVSEQVIGSITLNAIAYKIRGSKKVDLSWNGASGDNVDIYRTRNGTTVVMTTVNDGEHTDSVGPGGTYEYQVCETGSSNCSEKVVVFF